MPMLNEIANHPEQSRCRTSSSEMKEGVAGVEVTALHTVFNNR
uniref:Uncharacterized protein n=1 Tax=Candidatus Kentrum sp. FW TaxID=2126338 RepID=A0A450RWG0_9GAMM|nr:MAG: hypothetical protein BECKFW1821A_GA0114235_100410 [Candidatus Kentron sp. FW]